MSDTSKELTPQGIQRRPLPGYWHFAWMFFMQPVKLHYWLLASGVEEPGYSLWKLWISDKLKNSSHCGYVIRSLFVLLVLTPMLTLGIGWLCAAAGLPVSWGGLGIGVAVAVALGVAGCVIGREYGDLALGVAGGVAVGVAGGVALGVTLGVGDVPGMPMAIGLLFGPALFVTFGVTGGMVDGVAGCLVSGLFGGLVNGLLVSHGSSMRSGVNSGVAFGLAYVICHLRLIVWPLEFLGWRAGVWWGCRFNVDKWRGVPLRYHEMSYLPFPGLRKALVDAAETQADTVEALLEIAARVPGQQTTEARVWAELWARTLADRGKRGAWIAAVGLEGRWLPDIERAGPVLSHFRDVARHAAGAQGKLSASERVKGWQQALDLLASKNLPSPDPENRADTAFAKYHAGTLAATWRPIIAEQLALAQAEADKLLPNPFSYTALPLGTQESDAAVFQGREEVIAELQRLLTQPQVALGILGPRRVGKSSLLRRLPVELPGDLFVYFDLQDNPVANPAEFFAALAKRFEEAVIRLPVEKRSLPRLQEPSTLGVAAWFEALDGALKQRVVFCIDEYERLETLWSGDDKSLLQFMGLLRATIQHRRWVRVLIAGAAGPEELGRLWTDHFISVQEVRLDFLTEEQTLKLLCQATPGFPGPEALPLEIGRSIYRLTSGQPFLTQVFGFLLVQALNEDMRRVATEADVEATRVKVLGWAKNYFGDERLACEQRSTETLAAIMALAKDEPLTCDGPTRRWLRLRGMINEANLLRVELFKDYLRRRLAEEG